MPFFRFVQWDVAGTVGPAPGRYLLRRFAADVVQRLVVITHEGASHKKEPRRRRLRRARESQNGDVLGFTRISVVDPDAIDSDTDARAWLHSLARDDAELVVDEALQVCNQLLFANRVVNGDPYQQELWHTRAFVTRIAIGSGHDAAVNQWLEARELTSGRKATRRSAALRPEERLAAVLGGREAILACEELTLRARLDVNRGRYREAALQLQVAFAAALAELASWANDRSIEERLREIRELNATVVALGEQALTGGISKNDQEQLVEALERLEAALRARTAGSSY